MKPFKLYLGKSGAIGTKEITQNPTYDIVVELIQQLRARLLSDHHLRNPLLSLFQTVYNDDSEFPQHLKPQTPAADQILNQVKIREIWTRPPCDSDVIEFLTNSFPHLYLEHKTFLRDDILWGETISGRENADKEEVAINAQLIQFWVNTDDYTVNQYYASMPVVSGAEVSFMVMAVFLHELAHSSLVWYGRGACDSPKLGSIDSEAGNFYEKTVFGGIATCEIDKTSLQIMKVGICEGATFYPFEYKEVAELLMLDTSYGLPLTKNIALSPAPPPTFTSSRFRAKVSSSMLQFKPASSNTLEPAPTKSATNSSFFVSMVHGDKKRFMPRGGS